jgi:hypothetical protein
MSALNDEQFARASKEAVKNELRSAGWPVYKHYEIYEEDGEPFVVSPISFTSFFASEPKAEGRGQEGDLEGTSWQIFAGRDPVDDSMTIYAPLRTPELVLELAALADQEITPEDVLGWAQVYGLLGLPDDDMVRTDEGFISFEVKGRGRKDNVRRFAEAAGEIRTCLRAYEVITADEEVDLEYLSSVTSQLPLKALRPWERRAGEERSWIFRALATMVQMRLNEHCYPQFSIYTHGGLATGRFALSWGFKGLLGAIWLQMAWLLEAEGERVKRCKLPGCLRVVHFQPSKPALDPGLRRNARGKYKTRSDREFCKGRGCKQKYHYRKKAGWRGYA